jgi:starch synthase (maltosyl-transferring)
MWEWLIAEVRKRHPDVFFLAEAFTRPKVMYRLAKAGFSQSYNYFPWRNTKQELVAYLSEITKPPVGDFFRANLWPNTPDILPERLQHAPPTLFIQRFILAATLGASYGIYGPAFELCEGKPHGSSEEYADSEKYQLRHWNLDAPHSIRDVISRVNAIRREHPALQRDGTLRFHRIENDQLLAYSKAAPDGSDLMLVVVNLDPNHRQSGFLELPLAELGLDARAPFQAHDLLTGAHFFWSGNTSYVELDPKVMPAHIFRLKRKVRSEHDFDYFL